MNKKSFEKLHKINYMISELESLYHHAALKLGTSDSILIILYTLYDQGGSCLLADIYKQSGISKQTVNSAIRKLEKEKIVYLEQHSAKTKRVIMTEYGREQTESQISRLMEAEANAFNSWSDEDIEKFIALSKNYLEAFRKQVEEL